MKNKILIIEDEPGLLLTLNDRLSAEGYIVKTARDGHTGLQEALRYSYDLIILDIMLPGKNGFDVCRDLRINDIKSPVIMLTARGEITDKVVGLKLGADDYITKPFEMIELLARIEAVFRRSNQGKYQKNKSGIYHFADVRVDFSAAEVFKGDKRVEVSAQEFRLLCFLIENKGVVISRQQILNQVWGYNSMPSTRTVDVHIAWLRQKLEPNPKHPQFILTVHKLGYKFNH